MNPMQVVILVALRTLLLDHRLRAEKRQADAEQVRDVSDYHVEKIINCNRD